MSARVEQALAELGLTGHLTTSLVAAVGVKGASAGTARQQTGESQAVVRLGPNSDRRTLAVAFDWLTMSLVVP